MGKNTLYFSNVARLRMFKDRKKEPWVLRRMAAWVVDQVDSGVSPGTIENKRFTVQDVLVEDV
jgi:hypothetical protein